MADDLSLHRHHTNFRNYRLCVARAGCHLVSTISRTPGTTCMSDLRVDAIQDAKQAHNHALPEKTVIYTRMCNFDAFFTVCRKQCYFMRVPLQGRYNFRAFIEVKKRVRHDKVAGQIYCTRGKNQLTWLAHQRNQLFLNLHCNTHSAQVQGW
jgi:hypothetical protein